MLPFSHDDERLGTFGAFVGSIGIDDVGKNFLGLLHPGGVKGAQPRFMLDYWGLAFKQASEDLRHELVERQEYQPEGRKWKVAVCGPQRPAQVGLGPDFNIGWDSVAADFAMTLGEFYCKGLTAPVIAEIKRDDVVFAKVYDIRGSSISSLLAIPAP